MTGIARLLFLCASLCAIGAHAQTAPQSPTHTAPQAAAQTALPGAAADQPAAPAQEAKGAPETLPGASDSAQDAQAQVETIVPGDGRQGTIKTIKGEVTVVSNRVSRAAVVGGSVHQGDQIIVAERSAAAFTLSDGTVISLGPKSSLTLTKYIFEPKSENGSLALSLLKGTLRVVTGLITRSSSESAPAKVTVTTPTAVIGVRGTDVVVDANS